MKLKSNFCPVFLKIFVVPSILTSIFDVRLRDMLFNKYVILSMQLTFLVEFCSLSCNHHMFLLLGHLQVV
jgi:hypothetical protein